MLSTPLVGLTEEGFYHCSAGVHLAQEVGNLLLSSNKALKGLPDRTLLSSEVISKYIAEKPAFSTPMLDLRG